MTSQEKKEYLKQVTNVDRRINYLIKELEKENERRGKLLNISINYERDGSTNGSHSNSTENKFINIIEIDEYIEDINKEINCLYQVKRKIKQIINLVPDALQREILYRKYMLDEKPEKIWTSINYSDRQFWRLHGKALQNINVSQNGTVCH